MKSDRAYGSSADWASSLNFESERSIPHVCLSVARAGSDHYGLGRVESFQLRSNTVTVVRWKIVQSLEIGAFAWWNWRIYIIPKEGIFVHAKRDNFLFSLGLHRSTLIGAMVCSLYFSRTLISQPRPTVRQNLSLSHSIQGNTVHCNRRASYTNVGQSWFPCEYVS